MNGAAIPNERGSSALSLLDLDCAFEMRSANSLVTARKMLRVSDACDSHSVTDEYAAAQPRFARTSVLRDPSDDIPPSLPRVLARIDKSLSSSSFETSQPFPPPEDRVDRRLLFRWSVKAEAVLPAGRTAERWDNGTGYCSGEAE